jgi:hypothetical protein
MHEVRNTKRYTHKTSGFKTSGFKTSAFKTSGLQNVRLTKRQVSKRMVSKHPVFKFYILIKQKVYIGIAKFAFLFKVISVSLLLIMVIYGKKPSKMLAWLQQKPADFHQPQVQNINGCSFATGCFEDLTFCKPDIL